MQELRCEKLSYDLLAALALILVCSIYVGQLMQAEAAPFVISMRGSRRGVAYARCNKEYLLTVRPSKIPRCGILKPNTSCVNLPKTNFE